MISGICIGRRSCSTLQPLFSPGELLRITAVLRDTAAGFNASANRRIDAELCLAAPVRAGGQSGRRSRSMPGCAALEEQSGARRRAASRLRRRRQQAQQETAAPPEESDASRRLPRSRSSHAPSERPRRGFWPELVKRLKTTPRRCPEQAMFSHAGQRAGVRHAAWGPSSCGSSGFVRNLTTSRSPSASGGCCRPCWAGPCRCASPPVMAEKPNDGFARLVSSGTAPGTGRRNRGSTAIRFGTRRTLFADPSVRKFEDTKYICTFKLSTEDSADSAEYRCCLRIDSN